MLILAQWKNNTLKKERKLKKEMTKRKQIIQRYHSSDAASEADHDWPEKEQADVSPFPENNGL